MARLPIHEMLLHFHVCTCAYALLYLLALALFCSARIILFAHIHQFAICFLVSSYLQFCLQFCSLLTCFFPPFSLHIYKLSNINLTHCILLLPISLQLSILKRTCILLHFPPLYNFFIIFVCNLIVNYKPLIIYFIQLFYRLSYFYLYYNSF